MTSDPESSTTSLKKSYTDKNIDASIKTTEDNWKQQIDDIVNNETFPLPRNYNTITPLSSIQFLIPNNSSSTSPSPSLWAVENAVHYMFQVNLDLIENEKAFVLDSISKEIEIYGDLFVIMIKSTIFDRRTNPYLASELLQIIGEIEHPKSHRSRLWLLENCLLNPSKYIRDGAGIGLSNLGDPEAIPFVLKAIENETSSVLISNLRLVLTRLQQTQQCKQ